MPKGRGKGPEQNWPGGQDLEARTKGQGPDRQVRRRTGGGCPLGLSPKALQLSTGGNRPGCTCAGDTALRPGLEGVPPDASGAWSPSPPRAGKEAEAGAAEGQSLRPEREGAGHRGPWEVWEQPTTPPGASSTPRTWGFGCREASLPTARRTLRLGSLGSPPLAGRILLLYVGPSLRASVCRSFFSHPLQSRGPHSFPRPLPFPPRVPARRAAAMLMRAGGGDRRQRPGEAG